MIVSTKKSRASNVRPGHKSKKRKFSVNQSSNKTEDSLASTSPEKLKDADDNIEISSSIRTMENKGLSSPVVVAASTDTATTATTIPKKTTAGKTKKPRVNPTRPNTAEMVNAAIKGLADRGGSSLQAIKKYMVGKYKIDAEKQAIFIKKYLKAAVTSGVLIQTKGKGAAGSFKLASSKSDSTKPKKPKRASPKAKSPKKVVTTTIKKPAAAKPLKPKTTKANPAAKSPVKKTKPAAVKKDKPVTAKPKKAAPKKAVTAKK